jgi:hypothetical protein
MANYLYTSLFFCDKALSQTSFSRGDFFAFIERERPCFTAWSRHGASADSIAAMLAAKGSDHPHLDFIASKGEWPYGEQPLFGVLPFEDLLPIAESIDSLLAWSARSIALVTRLLNPDQDSAEEVQEVLKAPEISAIPNEVRGADWDGYGAQFTFSFLASIASFARDAHASQRALIFLRG